MKLKASFTVAVLTLPLVTISCGDSTAPDGPAWVNVSGVYEVIAVDGRPLAEPSQPGVCEIETIRYELVDTVEDPSVSEVYHYLWDFESEPACTHTRLAGQGMFLSTRDSLYSAPPDVVWPRYFGWAEWITYPLTFRVRDESLLDGVLRSWIYEKVDCSNTECLELE